MRFSRPPRHETPENVVPLINIVFLLLIFLMLAGTLNPRSPLKAELPAASEPRDPARPEADIVLDARGQLAFSGAVVSRDQLISGVREVLEREPTRRFRLLADRNTRARDAIALIEALKRAGVGTVDLMTERP